MSIIPRTRQIANLAHFLYLKAMRNSTNPSIVITLMIVQQISSIYAHSTRILPILSFPRASLDLDSSNGLTISLFPESSSKLGHSSIVNQNTWKTRNTKRPIQALVYKNSQILLISSWFSRFPPPSATLKSLPK